LEAILFKKFSILLLICLLEYAVNSYAENVDEVINKNLEARGGLEKINALTSMKLTGQI